MSLQDQCAIVLLVVRRVEQGHGAFLPLLPEHVQGRFVILEFGDVAPLELLLFGRVLAGPFPEVEVERGPFLADPVRPEPFDQHAEAVVGRGCVIDSLELEDVEPAFAR